MTESKLQSAINQDLRELKINFHHVEKGRGRNQTHRKGFPDLAIFPGDGRVFFVEIKSADGRLKPAQVLFKAWCKDFKYKFYVVSDLKTWKYIKKLEGLIHA